MDTSPERSPLRTLEIRLELVEGRAQNQQELLEILGSAHIRLQEQIIAYVVHADKISEEKAKALFDDLSKIQGEIVKLRGKS